MSTPLDRAEQAVGAAAGDIATAAASSPSSVGWAVRQFERAVEARTRERVACEIEARIDHPNGPGYHTDGMRSAARIARTGSKESRT